jgi:hypothetical protein
MKVQTRVTAQGTEYWDNEAKKTLFVPADQEPDFEVTENPKSMVWGVDVANGSDHTVINNEVVDLESKTIAELKEYAASKDLEIPADVKKKEDIVNYLYENWKPDAE